MHWSSIFCVLLVILQNVIPTAHFNTLTEVKPAEKVTLNMGELY